MYKKNVQLKSYILMILSRFSNYINGMYIYTNIEIFDDEFRHFTELNVTSIRESIMWAYTSDIYFQVLVN